jgi:hypothetical protein
VVSGELSRGQAAGAAFSRDVHRNQRAEATLAIIAMIEAEDRRGIMFAVDTAD